MPTNLISVSSFWNERLAALAPPLKTPTQELAFWLRRDIVRGVFPPNERLKVDQLSKFYQVGHSPVREAVVLLSPSGLVEHEHQKGYRVAGVSLADYDDLTDTARRIEALGIAMAVERGDEAWEEQMVLTLHRTSRVAKVITGDPEGREMWQLAYKRFHRELMQGCGSPFILGVFLDLGDRLERYLNLFGNFETDSLRDHHAEHRALVDVLLKREAAPAMEEFTRFFQRNQPVRDTVIRRLKALEQARSTRRARRATTLD